MVASLVTSTGSGGNVRVILTRPDAIRAAAAKKTAAKRPKRRTKPGAGFCNVRKLYRRKPGTRRDPEPGRQLIPAAIRTGRSCRGQKRQLQGLSFLTGRNTRGKPAGGRKAAQRPRSWYPLQLIPGTCSDPGGALAQLAGQGGFPAAPQGRGFAAVGLRSGTGTPAEAQKGQLQGLFLQAGGIYQGNRAGSSRAAQRPQRGH